MAFENWTSSIFAVNQASFAAAKEALKEQADLTKKALQLHEEVFEHEVAQLLFSGSDDEKVQYRSALRKKRLQKFMESSDDERTGPLH